MSLAIRILMMLVLASPLWAQQTQPSNPPVSSSKSSSSSDASEQQPQTTQPPSQAPDQETKPESKTKQKLKDLAPQCVGVLGASKCRQEKENPSDTKKDDQERQLRQQCTEAANQAQPQCVELRKSDSAHDTSVGDDYLSGKHYPSAINRYRLALQEDPTNVTAMLHLAQALEKSGNKAAGCEQFEKYLQQSAKADNPKDRDTINHLRHACGK